MNVEVKVKTRHPRDGARFAMDVMYDLRKSFPSDRRWDDYVVESEVTLTTVLSDKRRPQDVSRAIRDWFTQRYHQRLVYCRVTAGGSKVFENYELIRNSGGDIDGKTPEERSLVTHLRKKGDPYIEV